jgi:hypothetical protein
MKRIALLFCLSILSLFSCVSQKELADSVPAIYNRGFCSPTVFSTSSSIYFCAEQIIVYKQNSSSQDYEAREICHCFQTLISLLEGEISIHNDTMYSSFLGFNGGNTIIIWDKSFILNYLLPLFEREEERKKIEYTLIHSEDDTFTIENIIDFDNKVIINDKMYYYPLKIKQIAKVSVTNIPKFYSIMPQNTGFYKPNCFDDGKKMWINLLIPLLDTPQIPPQKRKKRVEKQKK